MNAVAYYRVSTQKQGQSGLGLEAQKAAVESFARGQYNIVAEFVEVESGKKNNRVQLEAALEAARANKATLLIAKLDRLSRSVAFTAKLNDAAKSKNGVKFIACDMPHVNEMIINMLAVVAQAEANATSERTKAALGAARARGVKLGNPENLTDEARAMGRETMRGQAIQRYKLVTGYIETLRTNGLTFRAIADQLNTEGHKTAQGKLFQPMTVKRVLDRAV